MAYEKDFTPSIHQQLLKSLLEQDYHFHTFSDYLSFKKDDSKESRTHKKCVILRHDVEKYYDNALVMAKIQNELGIRGSYYFRILPHHFQPEVIKEIANLGHEIGYHYDDLAACGGVHEKAILRFKDNLALLRNIAPIVSMSMDGSPLSKYDNKDLWSKEMRGEKGRDEKERNEKGRGEEQSTHHSPLTAHRSYHDFGIIGEPYFDLDFNEYFYLTDTGRCWDGYRFNVRDKATKENPVTNEEFLKLSFHGTRDIIKAVQEERFPKKAMLNFHPQRWNDDCYRWTKELVLQNLKNQVKRFLVKQ